MFLCSWSWAGRVSTPFCEFVFFCHSTNHTARGSGHLGEFHGEGMKKFY